MEKELAINGVKYVRADNKINFYKKDGIRYFDYKGISYMEFKENTFVAETILSKKIMDDIVEDKRYLDDEKDVMYNNDVFDNSWENSFVRKVLNSSFKEKYLKGLNLNGEVRLLTKDEVETLDNEYRRTECYGFWTMTPYNSTTSHDAGVFLVWDDGDFGWYNVYNTRGVRPVITLNTDNLE